MERGHASVEYIAVVAIVCAALAVVGGAAGEAAALPRAVIAQLERAYCLVSGGDCLGDRPRPCVVASRSDERTTSGSVVVIHAHDGRTIAVERRSDGTYAVTAVDTAGASLGRKTGASWASLAVGLHAAHGRAWTVADVHEADALVAQLREEPRHAGEAVVEGVRFAASGAKARRSAGSAAHGAAVVPPVRASLADPDERFADVGVDARAKLGADLRGLASAEARGLASFSAGVHVDRRTGERTMRLRLEREIVAQLSAPLARLAGGKASDAQLRVTFDADWRPVRLTVSRSLTAHGEARFGAARARRGDRVELEARLELGGARGAAGDLLAAARGEGDARAAAGRVAEAVAAGARLDARVFTVARRERHEGRKRLGVGVEREEVVETARLVDAAGWEPGLGWQRRLDCVGPSA